MTLSNLTLSQKLNSESKPVRYPVILHATCKIMGKLKQLLPQAAPSLLEHNRKPERERQDGNGESSQDCVVIAVWEVAARTLK